MTGAQYALDSMRRTLADIRAGRTLKTELVSEGTRTYERVVNEWRIKELEEQVRELSERIEELTERP